MSERTPYEAELERQVAALRERVESQARTLGCLREAGEIRNRELSALRMVWCTGCTWYDDLTEKDVLEVERYARRLRTAFANHEFKPAWKAAQAGKPLTLRQRWLLLRARIGWWVQAKRRRWERFSGKLPRIGWHRP